MTSALLRLAHAALHPDRVRGLLEGSTPERLLSEILSGTVSVGDGAFAAVSIPADDLRERLSNAGIRFVERDDGEYPDQLNNRVDAPPFLFLRGAIPQAPAVAVVGTRRCTAYGRRLAQEYGEAIAASGWTLVSGLARGIDGAAHRGTTNRSGAGVAILGSGIDVMYPAEHRTLGDELIAAGGAIVSEYPPGTPPEGWRFPP